MVLVGLHSDQSGERRWHTAIPAFAGAMALVAAAYSTQLAVTILAISVAVLGVFSMMGPFWAIPTAMLSGTAAAAGVAFINSVGNLGGFVGPYVIGLGEDVDRGIQRRTAVHRRGIGGGWGGGADGES